MALALSACMASAQTFPTKSIRIIVPFAAGGGTDVIARLLAQKTGEALGQLVVVENRAGGGSVIGSEVVARSAADGYTLLLTANPHTSNPALHPKLPYDTVRDFAAVTLVASAPLMLVVHPSLPASTVKELIALARARPGQLSYGSSGNGGPQHYAGELFKHMTGTSVLHVPYRGGAPATVDLLAGQVQLMFNSMLNVLQHLPSGRLRALAVTSLRRTDAAPAVPTVAESGLKDFEVTTWYGVLAPAGTPAPVIKRLNDGMTRALRLPEMVDVLGKNGVSAAGNTPEAFSRFIVDEIERFRKVARDSSMRIQ
jgi:tripartite-type tricarboxylate transporter receptor subunit TctC